MLWRFLAPLGDLLSVRICSGLDAASVFSSQFPRFGEREHLGAAQCQLRPLAFDPID